MVVDVVEKEKGTEEKRSMTTMILYGILIIIVVLVVVVLVARYAFNVDILNFNEVSGRLMRH